MYILQPGIRFWIENRKPAPRGLQSSEGLSATAVCRRSYLSRRSAWTRRCQLKHSSRIRTTLACRRLSFTFRSSPPHRKQRMFRLLPSCCRTRTWRHYWNPSGAFGRALSEGVGLKSDDKSVYAWDVWLVYGPEVTWGRHKPAEAAPSDASVTRAGGDQGVSHASTAKPSRNRSINSSHSFPQRRPHDGQPRRAHRP